MLIDNPKVMWNASIIRVDSSLTSTDFIAIVLGSANITLPSALSLEGKEYNIIRSGTSNVLISPVSSQTISGETNLRLTSQWDSVVLISDSSNWVRCS